MILISHDIHLARKVADLVCVLDTRRIVQQGAAFEILDRPRRHEASRLLDAALGGGV